MNQKIETIVFSKLTKEQKKKYLRFMIDNQIKFENDQKQNRFVAKIDMGLKNDSKDKYVDQS